MTTEQTLMSEQVTKEVEIADDAGALAHLAKFETLGEAARAFVADGGVSLVALLNGNKSSAVASVRKGAIQALASRGATRAQIAAVLRVTTTCVGSALPRTRKRDVIRRHGLSTTSEYRAWQTMRLRCMNPENPAYSDYGGRGIWVCARWLDSPVNFLADMGNKPSPAHEIDRIDNNKGYTCGHCEDCVARGAAANCRWTTRDVNDQNRRSTRLIEFRGETRALVEWARLFGHHPETISERIARGWSTERAITEPARPKAPKGTRKPVPGSAEGALAS